MARYGMVGEPSHSPGLSLDTTHTFQKWLIRCGSPHLLQMLINTDLVQNLRNQEVIEENLVDGPVWYGRGTFT